MKKGLSAREKVLLLILLVMGIFAAYYYMFYIPTLEDITYYQEETVFLDEQIVVAEGKSAKLVMMKKELDAIKSGDMSNVKVLPLYDNSGNVMSSLSAILSQASQYNISFGGVTESEGIVRRDISLNFSAGSYDAAKKILSDIYNGEYRCLMKDLHISQSANGCSINVQITYFEYK